MEWGIRFALIIAGSLILAVLARADIVRGLSSTVFGWLERPLTVVADGVSEQGEVVFASRSELIAELQEREQQVLDLARTASQWEQAQQERDEALALLNYLQTTTQTALPARVRVRAAPEDAEVVLIDKGGADGVAVGQPVVVGDGMLYGVVIDVFAQTARVARVTDQRVTLGARLISSDETIGVIEGGSGPVMQMRFVGQDTPVQVNDVIVTSGADPLVPPGIVIGLVNAVEEDPNAPFLTLQVEPLADLRRARLVHVFNDL